MKIPIEVTSSANTSGLKDAARDVENLGKAVKAVPPMPNIGAAPGSGGSGVSSVAAQVAAQVNQAGSLSAMAAAQQQQQQFQGMRSVSDLMKANALGNFGDGILGQAKNAAQAFSEVEKAQISLAATYGQGAPAAEAWKQAQTDALNVFGAGAVEIATYESQLRNAGASAKEARDGVLALSDGVAATGGNADKLQRLIQNLAQTRNEARFSARELRDFETNLIPASQLISKQLGLKPGELREKMGRGEISGAQAADALISQLQTDPRFAGRSKAITEETLTGQMQRSAEKFQIALSKAGEALTPFIEKGLTLANVASDFAAAHPTLTGAAAVGVTGVGLASKAGETAFNLRALADTFWGDRAATLQMTAAEMQLQAARMQMAGGLGGKGGAPVSQVAQQVASGAGQAAWYARTLGPQFAGPAGMQGATMGSAALGVGLGLGAAAGVYDDTGNATQAIATGIGAATLAAFNPPAAALIAAAEAIRLAANEAYSKPFENAPVNDGKLTPDPAFDKTKSPAERAAMLQQRGEEMAKRRNELENPGLWERATGMAAPFSLAARFAHDKAANERGVELDANSPTDSAIAFKNAAMLRNQNRVAPAIQQAADFEALKQRAIEQNRFKPGQDDGIISNSPSKNKREDYDGLSLMEPRAPRQRKPEVASIAPGDGGVMLVTLAIPTHPDIMGMFNDFKQATKI